MRVVGRICFIVAVFMGVGYGTMHWLTARAVARGTPEYRVRMGSALGGLFAGGGVATLVTLGLLLGGAPHPSDVDAPE